MTTDFGTLPTGETARLYTISCGALTAAVTDYGAALVRLLVPDARGNTADVVLGYDDANGYTRGKAFLGATVGRNANRIKNGCFVLGRKTYSLPRNAGPCNLHSGPDCFHTRLWQVANRSGSSITFRLNSPHGDQGFPGNAVIDVTYALEAPATLRIAYHAQCDRDTVFNMTNHSYFNLAGHQFPEKAKYQTLMMPARFYTPTNLFLIPNGELRSVKDTPMDFRSPKPLDHKKGYDHNFEVFCNPCAVLRDPDSGRTMAVSTDCPGVQLYTANGTNETGKGSIRYGSRSGVCLETQFYPDSVNHPEWDQPFIPAETPYKSETCYQFSW